MSADSHRLTPTERLHEVTLAFARRPTANETLTTKENAKGEALIEALSTIRGEEEDGMEWIFRHCRMHAAVAATLRPYPAANGGGE